MRSFLNWIKRFLGMSTVKCKGSKTVTRARKGDTGNGGITYRISVWEDGMEYHNDSALQTDGERIIDIAVNKAMSFIGDSSFIARKCKITHQADHQLIPLGNNTYWEDVNQFQPIVTPVLLAQAIQASYIDVDNLYVKHLNAADGTFKGSFDVEATYTEDEQEYVHGIKLEPRLFKIWSTSPFGGYEAVNIWPYANPDMFDRQGLVEIEAGNVDSCALAIFRGRVEGLNQGVQTITSTANMDARYHTAIIKTSSSITITLPYNPGSLKGQRYKIMNIYGAAITLKCYESASNMRVRGDGATGTTILNQRIFSADVLDLDIVSDGTYWCVVAHK